MKHRILLALAAMSLLLAGCYETDQVVITKGEKINIAGTAVCKNSMTGKNEIFKYNEESKGVWPFATYQYTDEKGEVIVFAKSKEKNLYIAQQQNPKSKRFSLYFVDIIDGSNFIVSAPDLASKSAYIDKLIAKYKVKSTTTRQGNMFIQGDNLLDYLMAHEKMLLSTIYSCVKK